VASPRRRAFPLIPRHRMAGVAAAIALVAFAAPASAASRAAPSPIEVTTSIAPAWVYFADTVTARVDVLFDRRRVDPSSIQVNPSFGIWRELEPARSASTEGGTIARRTWWFKLSCLAFACVPKGTVVQRFPLPPVAVAAKTLDGSSLQVSKAWPELDVAGRFLPPALPNVRPALRLQTAVPAATFRLDPTSLALALDGIGALVIALALGYGAFELGRSWVSRQRTVDDRPPLVRALALVRQAQHRAPEDRRRAVGLLARTLPKEGSGLTVTASEVAWSSTEPTAGRLEELARGVETELEEPS
jgi:hypothetical protein